MAAELPLTLLINTRAHELGQSHSELVKRLGYRNIPKGLRRLRHLLQGNLDTAADILAKLPDALGVTPETVQEAIRATRDRLAYREVQAREAADKVWRTTFKPHAVFVTERTTPSQITICGLVHGERLLHIDLDTTKPRATYIRQALNRLTTTNGEVPFFGRVQQIVINLTPDLALRYDSHGVFLGIVPGAVRVGLSEVTVAKRGQGLPWTVAIDR